LNIGIDELKRDMIRVSQIIGKKSVTRAEYESHGYYAASTFVAKFETWFKALEAVGLEKTRVYGLTKEDYFINLREVWIKLGRQPYYSEISKPVSKYSAGAYEKRFGTWRKALEEFIIYINNEEDSEVPEGNDIVEEWENDSLLTDQPNNINTHRTKRNITKKMRFLVLQRDYFKCKICGRSPSTDPKTNLHIDHILPWSKGGETELDNLQTLCSECNIGKGNISV
jgi:hypothetical protein